MGADQGVDFPPVFRAEGIDFRLAAFRHRLFEGHRVERFAANAAAHEIQGDDLVPGTFQKVLKFDGLLRADTPALTAAGAQAHVVPQCSAVVPVFIVQSRSRAVLNTSEAAVAAIVHLKIRHFSPFCPRRETAYPGAGAHTVVPVEPVSPLCRLEDKIDLIFVLNTYGPAGRHGA
jgi:hypothetical protein